jgi:hypothetical protein
MGRGLRADEPRPLELVPIEDALCTRLHLIEDVGFGARFVLTHDQTLYETGAAISVIKHKIVLPYAAIRPGIEMALEFMARRAVRVTGQRLLRQVK